MAKCLIVVLLTAALRGQETDLTSLSLEEFLNVEVTSVRRSRQKLSRTAAAVFVITHEDIRRTGAVSLPEVLRLAPGVHVARLAGSTWAIGIRGFTSVNSTKLLVMVDGRTLYHPLLSGVLWADNNLTLDDIERIEVIRGPGATIWGSNAVSGVINIITKRAAATQGGRTSVTAGTFDPARFQARYGGALGNAGHWRVSTSGGHLGQLGYSSNVPLRGWNMARAGTRMDWEQSRAGQFTLASELYYSNVPAYQTIVGEDGMPRNGEVVTGGRNGFVTGRWTRGDENGNSGSLQVTYDGRYMDAGNTGANLDTFDLDYQQTLRLPRGHQIVAGGGFRANRLRTIRTRSFGFDPADRTYRIYNVLLQDEWQIVPDTLYLTLGGKIEHNWGTGFAVQPTARLLWAPSPGFVAWGSWSRAVRTPSHVDFALRYLIQFPGVPLPVQMTGSEAVDSERLTGFDAGTRWQASRRLALDAALFRHRYRGLMAYQFPPLPAFAPLPGGAGLFLPALTVNGRDGLNYGGELVVRYDLHKRWELSGTYSTLWTSLQTRPGFDARMMFAVDSYDPRHQGYVRSSWDLPRRWSADMTFYRRGALSNRTLPGSNRLDFRLTRTFGEGNELSFGSQNLGRAGQPEAPVDLVVPRGIIRRGLEVSFTRRF